LVIWFTPCYLFSVKYTSIFSKKKYKQKGFTTVSCLFKIFFLREQVRSNGLLKSWSLFSSFKKRLLLSMRIQVGIFSMRIQVGIFSLVFARVPSWFEYVKQRIQESCWKSSSYFKVVHLFFARVYAKPSFAYFLRSHSLFVYVKLTLRKSKRSVKKVLVLF